MCDHKRAQWDEVRPPLPGDPLKSFFCGLSEVDDVIHRKGFGAWKKEKSTPYLCVDSQTGDIRAVFVLKTIGVSEHDIHLDSADDQSQVPAAMAIAETLTNRSGLYSGILLCQLGLSQKVVRHQRQGTLLLLQAMHAAVTAHLQSAVDFFIVDAATPELIDFYLDASGGLLLPTDELRLMAPMAKIHEYIQGMNTLNQLIAV